LLKRLVEGLDRFAEGKDMRQRISELKLPKEVLTLLLAQLEESKNGLYRALAKELRDFLEQTNFAEELSQALTKLTFEIRTEVRFVPSKLDPKDGVKPQVKANVKVNRSGAEPDQSSNATSNQDEESTTIRPTPSKED
jgi:hypothetical protein